MERHDRWRYSAGCRCETCRRDHAVYMRGQRAAKSGLPPGDSRHGTYTAYKNHMCRCGQCRVVRREYDRRRRAVQSEVS